MQIAPGDIQISLEPHVPNTSNIQSSSDMIVKFRVLKLWNAALKEQLTFHSRNEFTPGIRSRLHCYQSGSFAILFKVWNKKHGLTK